MKVIYILMLLFCCLKYFHCGIPKSQEIHFHKTFISGSPSVYSGVSNENTDDMYEDYHNNNGDDDHRDTVETELMRTPDFVSVPQVRLCSHLHQE